MNKLKSDSGVVGPSDVKKLVTGTGFKVFLNGTQLQSANYHVTYNMMSVQGLRLCWVLAKLGIYSARLPLPVGLDPAGKISVDVLPTYEME